MELAKPRHASRRIEADLHVLPPLRPEGRDRKALAEHVHGVIAERYLQLSRQDGEPQLF